MSNTIETLKSFAEDFTSALKTPCKLMGESGMYAIGKVGELGSMTPITQHYDAKTLVKVCLDFQNAMRLQRDRNDKFVIYSANESAISSGCGFWSNQQGWVDFSNATLYTADESKCFNLPVATGNDANWVLWEEANLSYGAEKSAASSAKKQRNDLCLHTENVGVASRSWEVCKWYQSADMSDDTFDTVFVYNHEGLYYRVFNEIQHLIENDSKQAIAEFETEEALEAFLNPALSNESESAAEPQVTEEFAIKSKVAVGHWDYASYTGAFYRGANCNIRILEDGSLKTVYISFCKQSANDDVDVDCYGVPDQDIYYYAEGGLEELNKLKSEGNGEFIVVDYDLVYYSDPADGFAYEIEVIDQRKSNGQLFVDVAAIDGNVDDVLAATFEINKIPGRKEYTQTMHLHFDGSNLAASFYKYGDKFIIRPETDVRITSTRLENGEHAFVLE